MQLITASILSQHKSRAYWFRINRSILSLVCVWEVMRRVKKLEGVLISVRPMRARPCLKPLSFHTTKPEFFHNFWCFARMSDSSCTVSVGCWCGREGPEEWGGSGWWRGQRWDAALLATAVVFPCVQLLSQIFWRDAKKLRTYLVGCNKPNQTLVV